MVNQFGEEIGVSILQWIVTLIVIIVLVVIGIICFGGKAPTPKVESCSEYGDEPMKYLPARCLNYFGINNISTE